MPPLPSLSDVKSYLGLTTTGDDALLTERLATAISTAEHHTSRRFSASSNTTTVYSTDGQSSIVIHDRPYTDASRVVTLSGATMIEGTNVWFLPDRRDPAISTTIQLAAYDQSLPGWYKVDPFWWDKNLDRLARYGSTPLDLSITGILGMPFPSQDIVGNIIVLTAYLYWKAKSGASGVVASPTGDFVELGETPEEYQAFVKRWTIKTAVSVIG